MKIAYFSDAFPPNVNGVSVAVKDLAERLSERHEIAVFCPAFEKKSRVEECGRYSVHAFSSFSIPTYKEIHLALPNIVSLIRQAEAFGPDVVHFHSPGTIGLLGIMYARSKNIPLVGTYHTLFSKTLMYASPKKIIEKYLPVVERITSGLKVNESHLGKDLKEEKQEETNSQKVVWSLVNSVYNNSDVVVCPSQAVKREISKRGFKKRLEVIPNGIDVKLFSNGKNLEQKEKILHAGRLGFEKNVDIVIKAFARLGQKRPEATLTIVGDGPAKEKLVMLAKELMVEKKVKFLGMVDRKRLPGIYREHQLFMTASTMETQGLVVLEAMACGLPVVAVHSYALPELVKNGVNGFLVRSGDDKAMAARLEWILADKKTAGKMSKKAVETAEQYDLKVTTGKMELLYQSLLGCSKPGWWKRLTGKH
jgi:1,2-diacylglycerol 3-alpha-glucosyltransferase